MKKGEIITSGVIVAFFLFMFIDSLKLHEVRRFGELGSGFWPFLILSSGILLGPVLLISNLIKYSKEKKEKKEQVPLSSEAMTDLRRRKRKIGLSILLLFIYILIMPLIGFVLSTLLYVTGFIFVLEERRRLVLALSPILVTGLVILIFSKFITMPFPRGLGIFAAFSRLFY